MRTKCVLASLAICGASVAHAISFDMTGNYSGTVYSVWFNPYEGDQITDYYYAGGYQWRNPSTPPYLVYSNSASELSVTSRSSGYISYGGAGSTFHYGYTRSTHTTEATLISNETQTVRVQCSLKLLRQDSNGTPSVTTGQISLMNGTQTVFAMSATSAADIEFDQVMTLSQGSYAFAMSSAVLPNGGGAGPEGVNVTSDIRLSMKITSVPEPGSMLVLGAGLAALAKKRKTSQGRSKP
jgi:hypothetical protein